MDAELFTVAEFIVAGKRQYNPGRVLKESDLACWALSDAELELLIADFVAKGKIEKIDRAAPVVEELPVRRMPSRERNE